jgi:hypothetical protein
VSRRRSLALGISALVHAAALAVLVPRTAPDTARRVPATAVEQIRAAELAAPDVVLPVRPAEDTFEASPRRDDESAFDIAKIRARENALFPFLTLDLRFLDRMTRDLDAALQRMSNPLVVAGQGGAALPLELTEEAIQRVTDSAWSRRDRWKGFAEIARLLTSHHPSRGDAPQLVRQYLDQNILQPYCDGDRHDPRFWAMLENAADHADFIDFVRSYTRRYPSSKTTTELLFLLDELAQGSRDVILMVLETRPEADLIYTRTMTPDAHQLAVAIKERYGRWLFDRNMDKREMRRHYDELRLRVLQTIVSTTPDGYRAADAQFLAGQVLFEMNRAGDAERIWRRMTPSAGDAYYRAATDILDAFAASAADARAIRRILGNEYGRWRLFSIDRLRQFGHHCDTF